MPKVSVIVPVYNMEKYIQRCLETLQKQTLQDIEIIVVNDGSTDESKNKIFNYIQKVEADKIKYFEKENGGLSSARNYGIKFATGEYIAFLDSDDYVEYSMYEELYNIAQKENSDMVECDFIWEWNNKRKIDKRKNYKNNKEFFKRPRVVAWNKIIRKSIIEQNNLFFPEGLIYEDIEFFYKLFPFLKNISYVDKPFIHYIQRQNSIINNQTEKVNDIFVILDNILRYYKMNNLMGLYEKDLKYVYKRILLGSSMKRILKLKDKKLRKNLIKKSIYKVTNFNIKSDKKRICFGITKLGIGGAERVLVDIANKICDDYDVTIFTIYKYGELEKELNEKIEMKSLYKNYNIFIPIYLLIFKNRIYRKYIKNKYDIEVAFLEGTITRIFSCKSKKTTKIAWVHNDISQVFGKGIKSKIKIILDKIIYSKYDKIIFVSKDNQNEFNKLYGILTNEEVIYNYIDEKRILKKANEFEVSKCNNNVPVIVSVARLVAQKGFDRFIRIHKLLLEQGIKHTVIVIGDGEEKENLQDLVRKLNVEDTFLLVGKKENPYPYIKYADYFALLSYYEGYGMVVKEAKILEKKIIITDTAAREAVQGYEKAIIAKNDEKDIFLKLKEMLTEGE